MSFQLLKHDCSSEREQKNHISILRTSRESDGIEVVGDVWYTKSSMVSSNDKLVMCTQLKDFEKISIESFAVVQFNSHGKLSF